MSFRRGVSRVVRIGIALGMVGHGVVGVRGSAAQEERPAGTEVALPRVVVTASRLEEPLEETASAVTVITAEEIERKQIRTVLDALRTVPDSAVVQTGSVGNQTSLFLRGANSSQTLVLINGVRVNSPTTGAFDFAHLTTDEVERIEVVRGPLSALYGSEAVGGVVNIITKKGKGKPTARASAEWGSVGEAQETMSVSRGTDTFDISLGGSRTDSKGFFPHDEYYNTTVGGTAGYQLHPSLRLGVVGRYTQAWKNLPATAGRGFDPSQNQSNEVFLGAAHLTHTPTSGWEHTLRVSGVREEVDFRDPAGSFFSLTRTLRTTAEWQHNLSLVSWDTLSLGLAWDQQQGKDSSGLTTPSTQNFDKTFVTRSLFGQNRLELLDRFIVTAGLRFDDHSAFGTHLTPRLSTAYLLKETGTKVRGGWGRGFKAPTINDLASAPPFGNPNLRPETSEGYDLGIEQKVWEEHLSFEVTFFRNSFKDLIAFSGGQVVNINRASTQGVEVGVRIRPFSSLSLAGSYTYLETKDKANTTDLTRRPANTWSLTTAYTPIPRLRTDLAFLYVGKRADIEPVSPFGPTKNPKYIKLDLAASYDLVEKAGPLAKLTLFGRLENLLGDRYDEALGFPAPGRTLHLGIKGVF